MGDGGNHEENSGDLGGFVGIGEEGCAFESSFRFWFGGGGGGVFSFHFFVVGLEVAVLLFFLVNDHTVVHVIMSMIMPLHDGDAAEGARLEKVVLAQGSRFLETRGLDVLMKLRFGGKSEQVFVLFGWQG